MEFGMALTTGARHISASLFSTPYLIIFILHTISQHLYSPQNISASLFYTVVHARSHAPQQTPSRHVRTHFSVLSSGVYGRVVRACFLCWVDKNTNYSKRARAHPLTHPRAHIWITARRYITVFPDRVQGRTTDSNGKGYVKMIMLVFAVFI